MRLSSLALFAIFTLLSSLVIGQTKAEDTERELILSVVYAWADTLTNDDLERRKEVTIDGSMNQRLRQQPDGSFTLAPSIVNFSDMSSSSSVMVERFWDEELVIRDQFATFIAAYDFWIEGKFSHCGTDVFDLIKVDGQWKIGNMKFTIIRDGCSPSPLGELDSQ
jgi:hypothetical protein